MYYTIVRRPGRGRGDLDAARDAALAHLLPLVGVSGAAVAHDEDGRPYFAGRPDLFVSVSHGDGLTAVSLSARPVGIDLESAAAIRDPEGLSRRFFTETEQAEVASAPDVRRAVLGIWTRKEALGKYRGTGLAAVLGDTTCEADFHTRFFLFDGVEYAVTVYGEGEPEYRPFEADFVIDNAAAR